MKKLILVAGFFLMAAGPWARAQHYHLNAGAASASQGAPLQFANGEEFGKASGFVKAMVFATEGRFANYYQGNISVTALHSTNAFGEPAPGGPARGAFLQAEVVSLNGPEGGQIGFWDGEETAFPTFSISAGTTNATHRFDLSEAALGAGQPGGDPYGHIHGRRMTVTKPGLYRLGIRVVDSSGNGAGEGQFTRLRTCWKLCSRLDIQSPRYESRAGWFSLESPPPQRRSSPSKVRAI